MANTGDLAPDLPPMTRIGAINRSGGGGYQCLRLEDGWLEVLGAMVGEWRPGEAIHVDDDVPLGRLYVVVHFQHRVYLRPAAPPSPAG